MKKRHFLGAALSAAALPGAASGANAGRAAGPALLTLTGALAHSNRGPFDPVLDQMMHKQKLSFDKAFGIDFGALLALPALSIRPTLEYDARPHTLRGPVLLDVVALSGTRPREDGKLLLRAVDGYAVALPVAQARAQRFIVATHLDGKPMALGGLGPLWAVYDADRFADMAARPLAERFGACPWALYHIEVAG
ncbi:molybdopterin-dependent oxidoreductase [Massilia sp. CCM 8734]|uniref:molybdopterin-dependent oxidoreductase n=1 Tax=Massilia sp. CCM 8734 TaxID=2609283 RepID=UPI0014240381|nr:molybdopterin-dependent oxidoreductase [Massilia sp. CCM 8734]NHZ97126.1 molybdopterin-dependent oxidoreductase [Massilia sp. CCM 8734]